MNSVSSKYNDLVLEVAKELNVNPKFVIRVLNFYYKSIKGYFYSLDLNRPEDFCDLNVPSLFTLVPTYKKALGQVHKHNRRCGRYGQAEINIEEFKSKAVEDMNKLIPELKGKRAKSQCRDNKYNKHRALINKNRNNEDIYYRKSETSHSA